MVGFNDRMCVMIVVFSLNDVDWYGISVGRGLSSGVYLCSMLVWVRCVV